MNILYVYAHPNPDSFNGMLFQHAQKTYAELNANVRFSDLYESKFRAVADWHDFKLNKNETDAQYFLAQQQAFNTHHLSEDIANEIKKLAWADHIIFQFPLWWFSVPAILKGWFDRVLVKGFAYDAGKVFQDGLLKGKTASLVTSTQSPQSAYQTDGPQQGTIETFLHHIDHTLYFVGIKMLKPFVSYAAFNLDEKQKEKILADYAAYLKSLM